MSSRYTKCGYCHRHGHTIDKCDKKKKKDERDDFDYDVIKPCPECKCTNHPVREWNVSAWTTVCPVCDYVYKS